MPPNFEKYSLDELLEASKSIDRQKYPERYEEIRLLISQRLVEMEPQVTPNQNKLFSNDFIFRSAYFVFGLIVIVLGSQGNVLPHNVLLFLIFILWFIGLGYFIFKLVRWINRT